MTELGVFGVTIRCHPELVSGSNSKNEEPGRVASERRTGLLGGDGGPLTDNVFSVAFIRSFPAKRALRPGQFLPSLAIQHDLCRNSDSKYSGPMMANRKLKGFHGLCF